MTIQVRQIGASASTVTIRRHQVVVDRPVDKGGADEGPMGGELFLAAIGGCFMSNMLAAIKAREAEVSNVQTDVTATLAGSPPCFAGFELCVTADCADRQLLEKLVEIAERGCIMMNTLRGKIEVRVRIGVPV